MSKPLCSIATPFGRKEAEGQMWTSTGFGYPNGPT
jgi:hypothetical protein